MDSDTPNTPELELETIESGPLATSPKVKVPTRQLQREVLYPQRHNTGVGVMLVASAAMFFAVASSAFILRSQMPAGEHCPGSAEQARPLGMQSPHALKIEAVDVELVDVGPAEATSTVACGEPLIRDGGEGPDSVVFRLCAPRD